MRFPPTLFGFPMTEGLWLIIFIIGAIIVISLIMKIFKNVIKDFASGAIIFILIIVFGFMLVQLFTGQSALEGGFGSWFNSLFQ